jgi:uroporphyrinogen-III synthase
MTAICVGARTAEMAKAHGLIPISADGTVEDLLELLIAQKPEGGLVHLRGAMARGDLAPRLRANGIEAADVICYRQVPVALNDAAKSVLDGENPVILPLYSPETARLCGQAGPFRAQISVIAMSAQVARAAEQINAGRVVRVEHPNGANMLAAITSAVATLVQLEGRSGKG